MNIYDHVRTGIVLIEALACIIGFLYWNKIKHTYWKWFPAYLLFIAAAEMVGLYLSRQNLFAETIVLHKFFTIPLQMFFFYWLFYKQFEETPDKKWPIVGAALFGAAFLYEMTASKEISGWFVSFSYTVGNVMLAGLILLFFVRYVRTDRILFFKSDMIFWVCLGAMIFYLGSLPYYGLYNTLKTKGNGPILNTYWFFQMGFNYLMYIFFSIAFIWGRPR